RGGAAGDGRWYGPGPAGTASGGRAAARPASTTRTGAPRCASRSASASSRTSGTATCAKCAARPTSTFASATPPPGADMARPRLALVPGEPAGVGPELCVRAAQRTWNADLVAYGDGRSLLDASDRLGLPLQLVPPDTAHVAPGQLRLVEIANAASCRPGTPDPRNAAAVIAALSRAADDCLAGRCPGLVTGPVHKATINLGGIAYTGTTELLAAHAGCEVVMMLANDIVRVALATTHLPLRAVADAITADGLERTLRILGAAMRTGFGID